MSEPTTILFDASHVEMTVWVCVRFDPGQDGLNALSISQPGTIEQASIEHEKAPERSMMLPVYINFEVAAVLDKLHSFFNERLRKLSAVADPSEN